LLHEMELVIEEDSAGLLVYVEEAFSVLDALGLMLVLSN